jgi:hemerythrin-like domain-containing protein
MCDYCDCRSHPQIASLSADHERMLRLLAGLHRAVDRGDEQWARQLIAELRPLLDLHTTREEGGVFTELRRADVDRHYVEMFEHEHEELHGLLAGGDAADWRRVANELIRVLGDHIAREESDLFPAAHQLLRPDQWDAVDEVEAALGDGKVQV